MNLKQKLFVVLCTIIAIAHILFPVWTFELNGKKYAAPEEVRSFVAEPPPNPPHMPGKAVVDLSATFFTALAWILRVMILYWAYVAAKHFTLDSAATKVRAYCTSIAVTAVLAYIAWSIYGTHIENSDPLYGGGDIVKDFDPTLKERNEHAVRIFLFLTIPVIIGTFRGLRERRKNKE